MDIPQGIEAFADVQRDCRSRPPRRPGMRVRRDHRLARGARVEVHSVNCTLGDIGTQDGDTRRPPRRRPADRNRRGRLSARHPQHAQPWPSTTANWSPTWNCAPRSRLYRLTQADTLLTFDPYWAGQIHPDHRAAWPRCARRLHAFQNAALPPGAVGRAGRGAGASPNASFSFPPTAAPMSSSTSPRRSRPNWPRAWRTAASFPRAKKACNG